MFKKLILFITGLPYFNGGSGVSMLSSCERCGSEIDSSGFCEDVTCPFSDHLQGDPSGWIGHPEHEG